MRPYNQIRVEPRTSPFPWPHGAPQHLGHAPTRAAFGNAGKVSAKTFWAKENWGNFRRRGRRDRCLQQRLQAAVLRRFRVTTKCQGEVVAAALLGAEPGACAGQPGGTYGPRPLVHDDWNRGDPSCHVRRGASRRRTWKFPTRLRSRSGPSVGTSLKSRLAVGGQTHPIKYALGRNSYISSEIVHKILAGCGADVSTSVSRRRGARWRQRETERRACARATCATWSCCCWTC